MEIWPRIEVQNRQRAVAISLPELQRFAEAAMGLVWHERHPEAEITRANTILVSLLSDTRMARLHKQFCGMGGATDVLTFQHGEIMVSAETAARQARLYRQNTVREIQFYILHGLLHLCGYDDTNARTRKTIHRVQERLFRQALERMRSFERVSPRVNLPQEPARLRGRTNERRNGQRHDRSARNRKS